MPEYVSPSSFKKAAPGAMLDNAVVRRDLFYLAAMFLADPCVSAIATRHDGNAIPGLWNEFIEPEITLRLATTASFLRARDDYVVDEVARQDDPKTAAWAKEVRKQECGTLQPDVDSSNVVPLTLREACNKIIHATEYRFDVVGDGPGTHIQPFMYLYGFHNKKRWRVVLHVMDYVEAGISYTDFS